MTAHNLTKPRLPSHYYVWSEPPDSSGDEVLHFVSERRRIKLKGQSFREFEQRVVPLLDGRHTIAEIGEQVSDVFSRRDLEAALDLLATQNLLEDVDFGGLNGSSHLEPQLNFFHEAGLKPAETQQRLRKATATVFGLSGAGAGVAQALAAAGVGTVRCLDSLAVSSSDLYLCPLFSPSDVGAVRTDVVARSLETAAPMVKVQSVNHLLVSDDDVLAAVEGSSFVACCLDQGQSALIYKLNRACLRAGIPWSSCALSGSEVIVGPTIDPFETACYLCYKMRVVACAGNPEDSFAFEKLLDRRKQDDNGRRENLVFGAAIAANLLALEVVREIAGLTPVPTRGRIVVFDLLEMKSTKHVVLRKPWCPACFRSGQTSTQEQSA